MEESGAEFDIGPLFGVMNVPRVGQVHLFYLCALRHDRFDPGTETMEAQLFAEEDIPWDEIAFLTVRHTLQNYFEDRRRGAFGVHSMDFSVKDFPPGREPAGGSPSGFRAASASSPPCPTPDPARREQSLRAGTAAWRADCLPVLPA